MSKVAAICFLTLASWAQDSAAQLGPLEKSLTTKTQEVLQAEKDKDVAFLTRTLTPDFVAVGSEGRLHDRSEILESTQSGELHDFSAYNFRVLPVHEGVVLVTYDCVIHMPEGDAP